VPGRPKHGEPLGFPECPQCYWYQNGNSLVCGRCAGKSLQVVTGPACPVCSRALLSGGGRCGNPLCNAASRSIERIHAVSIYLPPVDYPIRRLKYHGGLGWATVFGRLVVGHLDAHHRADDYDLIVANPTFPDPAVPTAVRHTELVLDAAAADDVLGVWPFDTSEPRAVIKTGPTPKSAGGTYGEKVAAADALLEVLSLTDPSLIGGKRVLVYDDVCTTGLQLDRVARHLKALGGARSVEALVLARAPWRGP
jgi:predicted amidophosphoribosyltransferase